MNFYNEIKEIIHSEYDWDDISSGNIAKAITDIHNKQLANIKHLNADEVEHIIGSINTNQEKVQAICKLAIPEDDFLDKLNDYIKTNPDKIINQIMANVGVNNYKKNIIKILHEFVKYQIEADNLINNEAVEYVADEIIKALEGK